MAQVTLDFETASGCDLKVSGAARYWEDPSTDILCLSWRTGGRRGVWHPGESGEELRALAADPAVRFVAHNTWFEWNGWTRQMVPDYGFPPIEAGRWEDTQAVCHYKAIEP